MIHIIEVCKESKIIILFSVILTTTGCKTAHNSTVFHQQMFYNHNVIIIRWYSFCHEIDKMVEGNNVKSLCMW